MEHCLQDLIKNLIIIIMMMSMMNLLAIMSAEEKEILYHEREGKNQYLSVMLHG
jgi:hypothetical protein